MSLALTRTSFDGSGFDRPEGAAVSLLEYGGLTDVSQYPGGSSMHLAGDDERGWSELRAWQDDETLARFVRLLGNAYERRDRSGVRAQAVRLLLALPRDFAAAQILLRRLRDLGE